MFDIDRYLDEIRIKEFAAPEPLVQRTQTSCADVCTRMSNRSKKIHKFRKAALIAVPAAAVLVIGVLIGAIFFGAQMGIDTAEAYYTVDINPSVRLDVDGDDNVIRIDYQNDDAKKLMKGMDCVGMPAVDVIKMFIIEAEAKGFISEDGKYVLIGRFDASGQQGQTLDDLQALLEANFGDMIDLLIVSGTFEDVRAANMLKVSAGLLKLSEMAEGVEVGVEDKVEDVVEEVTKNNNANFTAPKLSVAKTATAINFSWSELDFAAMGYLGEVSYHLVYADNYSAVAGKSAAVIKTFTFDAQGELPRSWSLSIPSNTINCDEKTYFGIYAEYSDGTLVVSNVVSETVSDPSPSTKPSPTSEPQPSENPEDPGGVVSGYISGKYVMLNWEKDTSGKLSGYKIVASQTNPNPAYPADGYLKYITNSNTSSTSLYEGYGGLKGNTFYYFSVTYLYKDGTKVAGNAVRLRVPHEDEDPDPTATPVPGDKVSTNISGSLSEINVNLSWGAVSHSDFVYYKVVAAKHANPAYPADGYIAVISNSGTTSCSFSISNFDAGETYWFAITVVYSDGTKLTGNDISLTMPGPAPTPTPDEPYVTATISGSLGETHVNLSWSMVDHTKFQGYKVVAARHSNPSYPSDGYLKYITSAGSTSYSKLIDDFIPGETYWFAITVLYSDGTRRTGNDISITMPSAPEPSPSPSPSPSPTTTTDP